MKLSEAERILGIVGGAYVLEKDATDRFMIKEAVEDTEIREWAKHASTVGYALNMISGKGSNPTIFRFIEIEKGQEALVITKEKKQMDNTSRIEEIEKELTELREAGEDENAETIDALETELASLSGLEDEGTDDSDATADAIRAAQESKKKRGKKNNRKPKTVKVAKADDNGSEPAADTGEEEEIVVRGGRGGRRSKDQPYSIKADPKVGKKNIRSNIRAMIEVIESSEAAEPVSTRQLQLEDSDLIANIKLTGAEKDGKLVIDFQLNEETPLQDQYKFYAAVNDFLGLNGE
jgi:hypothetical protein